MGAGRRSVPGGETIEAGRLERLAGGFGFRFLKPGETRAIERAAAFVDDFGEGLGGAERDPVLAFRARKQRRRLVGVVGGADLDHPAGNRRLARGLAGLHAESLVSLRLGFGLGPRV